MEAIEYKLMQEVQDTHWWYLGREKLLKLLIDKYFKKKLHGNATLKIADLGSGFGSNISLLTNYGDVYALEMNEDCLNHLKKNKNIFKVISWKSPEKLDLKFDMILMADVLEHIPNDMEVLEWIEEHLNPGGMVFITVPAHMFLWSEMDDVVHHFRRYSKKQLRHIVPHNLKVKKLSFYNAILFPVKVAFVLITRLLRKILPKKELNSYNQTPPVLFNAIFKSVMYLESYIIKYLNIFFGVSLVLVLEK